MEIGKDRKALIIVDVQNDRCSGGVLPVPGSYDVVPVIIQLLDSGEFDFWAITLYGYPKGHCSFIENGGTIPANCVECTPGAELHPDLKKKIETLRYKKNYVVIPKGLDSHNDSHSGFGLYIKLEKILKERNIKQVFICGFSDGVKATALDSQKEGFETFVVINACRGVNVNEGDVDKAIEEMKNAGIQIIEK